MKSVFSQNNISRGVPLTMVMPSPVSLLLLLYDAKILDPAHPIDIFSLAVTDKQILSASGASSIQVHSTTDPDFPLAQSIEGAHKVGCHHIVTDQRGSRAVSVGFGGEIQVWTCRDGTWSKDDTALGNKHAIPPITSSRAIFRTNRTVANTTGSGEVWAVALSENGQYLAGVSQDGHIKAWDLSASGEQIRDYETKGSFGTCLDMVSAPKLFSIIHDDIDTMHSPRMVVSSPADMKMAVFTFLAQTPVVCRFLYQVCYLTVNIPFWN